MLFLFFMLLGAFAAPFAKRDLVATSQWDHSWVRSFEIHESCNSTQTNQLTQAFSEMNDMAQHAKDHILRYGNNSEFYQKYFGDAPTFEAIGVYDNVLNANKTGVLFRCDNPDGNCKFSGWAGHWRGSNATDETVICDYSYTSRLYLSQMCTRGYSVSGSSTTLFWASDLLHRVWHTETIGQNIIDHYADTYSECLELAENNATLTTRNSATLRYFALDVYAYDIAVPGVGCTKPLTVSTASTSSATATTLSTSTTGTKTSEATTESTDDTTSGQDCHTHADGVIHCV